MMEKGVPCVRCDVRSVWCAAGSLPLRDVIETPLKNEVSPCVAVPPQT